MLKDSYGFSVYLQGLLHSSFFSFFFLSQLSITNPLLTLRLKKEHYKELNMPSCYVE